MSKGKSIFCTWYCTQCNKPLEISYYKKGAQNNTLEEKKKFCNKCRGHKIAKRKDTKS